MTSELFMSVAQSQATKIFLPKRPSHSIVDIDSQPHGPLLRVRTLPLRAGDHTCVWYGFLLWLRSNILEMLIDVNTVEL